MIVNKISNIFKAIKELTIDICDDNTNKFSLRGRYKHIKDKQLATVLTKCFIDIIEAKYGDIGIVYHYSDDVHWIDHKNYDLEFSNHDFACFAGEAIQDVFYSNDIYNICFSYDREDYFK